MSVFIDGIEYTASTDPDSGVAIYTPLTPAPAPSDSALLMRESYARRLPREPVRLHHGDSLGPVLLSARADNGEPLSVSDSDWSCTSRVRDARGEEAIGARAVSAVVELDGVRWFAAHLTAAESASLPPPPAATLARFYWLLSIASASRNYRHTTEIPLALRRV